MKTWSQLHEVLKEIMGDKEVYYQPPENVKLTYPCIVFENSTALSQFADNKPYVKTKRYTVTLVTKTADNDFYKDQLMDLSMCTFDREFRNDGIVNTVFNMYY